MSDAHTFPVIGVTGLPCSGKSFAAGLLADGKVSGLPAGRLYKADDAGHAILQRDDVKTRLRERFGEAAFPSQEPADIRRAVAGLVFTNPDNLAWLESVIHPLVVEETDAIIAAEKGKRPVIVEAALLFAADMDVRCDRILLIESDFAVRLGRAAKRGWSREELQRREARQIPLFTSARQRDSASRIFTVDNNSGVEELLDELSSAISRQPGSTGHKRRGSGCDIRAR